MKNERILVIDDNETTRWTLQTLLASSGLHADCCDNGITALDLAKEGHYEAFLIDYRMPEMTGDDLTRLLRNAHPSAFIIGFSVESKDQAFLSAGADMFISKADLARMIIPAIKNAIHA